MIKYENEILCHPYVEFLLDTSHILQNIKSKSTYSSNIPNLTNQIKIFKTDKTQTKF